MVTQPEPRGSSSFRKVSKPLMEKKRRARINVSLEQLKTLLEKNYSQNIRKRKLEKADILELTVKYLKTLQNSVQASGVFRSSDYQAGFRNCLHSVNQFLLKSEDCSSPIGHLTLVQDQSLVLPPSCFSTKDNSPIPTPIPIPIPTPIIQKSPANITQSSPWGHKPNKVQSPCQDPSSPPCSPEPPALSITHSPVNPSRCPLQNMWRPW